MQITGGAKINFVTSLRRHYPDQVLRVCSQPFEKNRKHPGKLCGSLFSLKIKNRNKDIDMF